MRRDDRGRSALFAAALGLCLSGELPAEAGTIVGMGWAWPEGELSDLTAIAAGESHSLGLRRDGSIAAWGSNSSGEARPPAGNDFVAIAAGNPCSMALRASRRFEFVRGDCNGDGGTGGVTDAVVMLMANFVGGIDIPCLSACDADGDGAFSGVSDAIHLLGVNFLGTGGTIPAPFPDCGPGGSPGDEALGCAEPPASCAGR